MKDRWGISIVAVLVVASMARVIYADARDDLGRARSDYDAVKSHYDSAKSKLEGYLEESVKLRAMDKDQLNELVTQICKLDVKRDDDDADRLTKDLRDKVIDRVKREYARTVDDGTRA